MSRGFRNFFEIDRKDYGNGGTKPPFGTHQNTVVVTKTVLRTPLRGEGRERVIDVWRAWHSNTAAALDADMRALCINECVKAWG